MKLSFSSQEKNKELENFNAETMLKSSTNSISLAHEAVAGYLAVALSHLTLLFLFKY